MRKGSIGRKLLFVFCICAIIFGVAFSVLTYVNTSRQWDNIFFNVELAITNIAKQEMGQYIKADPEYYLDDYAKQNLDNVFNAFADIVTLHSLTIMVETENEGCYKVIYNIKGPGRKSDEVNAVELGDVIDLGYTLNELSGFGDSLVHFKEMNTENYVNVFSDGEKSIGMIACAVSKDYVQMTILLAVLRKLVYIMVGLALIALAVFIAIKTFVIKPARLMTEHLNGFVANYAKGDEFVNMQVSTDDEFGAMARAFNFMGLEIGEYIENNKLLITQREKANAELKAALEIQLGILPSAAKYCASQKKIAVSAFIQPAKTVGGDFYDFFDIDENKMCLIIGDVSGKGLPAAMFMMTVKTMLFECALNGHSPAHILSSVNFNAEGKNPALMFATVFIGILDKNTGLLTFSNAGHNPPILKTSEGTGALEIDTGTALAIFDDAKFVNQEITLNTDDILLLYTDGVTEAVNGENEFFGEERLLHAVATYHGYDCSGLTKHITNTVEAFYLPCEQWDDITMVCLAMK